MQQKIFRWFAILILILAVLLTTSGPQPAHAAGPRYVAPNGDDNDCLSPGSSCATIHGAIGKAAAGEIINVAVGTYVGTGSEVVLIDKDINLSGGWDATFTAQRSLPKNQAPWPTGHGASTNMELYPGQLLMG